jgi:mono/diheme cytochrome c family protein
MRIDRSRIIPSVGTLLITAFAGLAEGDEPSKDAASRVRGLLADKCLACHAPEPKKGGLDLTRRASALEGGENGPAFVPGRPAESLLIEKVEGGEMPPGRPLEPGEVAAFRAWIEAGAGYEVEPLLARRAGPDWWSLRPVGRVAVPRVKDEKWVRTPVDAFLLDRLERDGLGHAPEADRATFLRRVSFDLIGLPPSPEEVDAFVADPSPDAHERLVDRLLASPRYGERWGRHWLDVVRFAESHGYETNNLRPDAWPYRDYVIRAFNLDTPFPRFAEEQLAGDALPDADWLSRSATGFLVAGSHDVVGNQAPEAALQQRADDLDDMIAATSTAFLGLTVQCARCHDHKFDPITQKDYYGLQAAFAGVAHASRDIPRDDPAARLEAAEARLELARLDRELDDLEPLANPGGQGASRPPVDPRRNVERFEPVEARSVRFAITSTNSATEPCLDELEAWSSEAEPRNVASAALGGRPSASSSLSGYDIHRVEHLNDGRYGNGRSWIGAEGDRGWAQVEFARTTRIDRVVWGRDREGNYSDRTPLDYTVEVATEPGQWRVVASSRDRLAKAGPADSRGECRSSPPTGRSSGSVRAIGPRRR